MKQILSLVPEELLDEIKSKQDKIISLLENGQLITQNEFITESQAKEILQKKSTSPLRVQLLNSSLSILSSCQ